MALGKCIFILLLMHSLLLSQITYGQKQNKLFRSDYKFLDSLNSFYKIHTLRKIWVDAKKRCAFEGATLWYPEDLTEAETVMGHLNDTQPLFSTVFVGVSSMLAKGVFKTVDGIPLRDVYNIWASGEPNDANGHEDCVVMRNSGFYNDDNCLTKFPFICKKTLASLNWNDECNVPDMGYRYNALSGRCYKFHNKPLNWRDALEMCDAEQSNLAIINNEEEAEILVNITNSAPKVKVSWSDLKGAVHLGYSYDIYEEEWKTTEGETLEQAGYAVWGNHQPDGGENERCGSMFYNGHLNDISCTTQKCVFICERENEILSILSERFGTF